jgi:hypothetical protein
VVIVVTMTDWVFGVRIWVIEGNGFSKVGRMSGRGEGVIGVEGDGNSNDKEDWSAKGRGRGVIGVEGDGKRV